MRVGYAIALLSVIAATTAAFSSQAAPSRQDGKQKMQQKRKPTFRTSVVLNGDTGGWGIGNSREMVPEEFARGNRRAFEGYKLTDRGEFMRKVKADKDDFKNQEMDELMGVAKMAGIKVKDPKERLNKFDQDLLVDEDDDLDLSV